MPLATPQGPGVSWTGRFRPFGQAVAQVAAINPAYYLTGEIFSVNCIFLYGDLATNRSLGSRPRLRLPTARSGFLLWPLPAWPFCGKTAPGHRSARIGARQVAQGSGARAGASRHLHWHGGVPKTRLGDFRHFGGLGRPQPPRTISPCQIRSFATSESFRHNRPALLSRLSRLLLPHHGSYRGILSESSGQKLSGNPSITSRV